MADLIRLLQERGYSVIGPQVRDGAIIYDVLSCFEDLPEGWSEEQETGRYRLIREGKALFGYTNAPQSWKRFLHPPQARLFEAERLNGDFRIIQNETPAPKYAFLGVRACEIAAIRLQDLVLLETDPIYTARRRPAVIIAVQCTRAAPTCFCASMGTGPRATDGFDLALTELPESETFLVETGTDLGAEFLSGVEHQTATEKDLRAAEAAIEAPTGQIFRTIDTANLPQQLWENFDNPYWDRISARCLSCANCTMVCPTCFCTTVEDTSDPAGHRADRHRKWDSCFTESFSYIHGGSVRLSVKSRYRQWLTHKLASWVDQFGSFGCVGCGRCITWCPAKIDITRETAAILGKSL